MRNKIMNTHERNAKFYTEIINDLKSEKLELVHLLMTNAKLLYDSCMVFNPAPVVERRYERLINPVVGDLVIEMSAQFKWETEPLDCIGRLVERSGGVWTIETFDKRIVHWDNCQFIVVPDRSDFDKPDDRYTFQTAEEKRATFVKAAKLRHNL